MASKKNSSNNCTSSSRAADAHTPNTSSTYASGNQATTARTPKTSTHASSDKAVTVHASRTSITSNRVPENQASAAHAPGTRTPDISTHASGNQVDVARTSTKRMQSASRPHVSRTHVSRTHMLSTHQRAGQQRAALPFENPFTPVFGGKLTSFFGRETIIDPFTKALSQSGSAYRTLFITGARGMGKTTLLERLSQIAVGRGWEVLDLPPVQTVDALFHRLVSYDETTETRTPSDSISVLGTGGSVGGMGTSKTRRASRDDLCEAFIQRASKAAHGILVTIDEVQKVALEDVVTICSAFQMASRKGYDVALAVAGLPYAHERITEEEGCTYMRRAKSISLGLLSRRDVRSAYAGLFGQLGRYGVRLGEPGLNEMVNLSKGQPFFMQLLGYEVVDDLQNEAMEGEDGEPPELSVTPTQIASAFERAMDSYAEQSLEPILGEAQLGGQAYLATMAELMGEDGRVARTGDIAAASARPASSLSSVRARLLRLGIIVAPERGVVRFNVPYLREYLLREHSVTEEEQLLDEWDV